MGKSRLLERMQLANQTQASQIPDCREAGEKNNIDHWL